MVKKLAWPFGENENLIFEIKEKGGRYLIIGYYKPEEETANKLMERTAFRRDWDQRYKNGNIKKYGIISIQRRENAGNL
jgi:hypothetical protein